MNSEVNRLVNGFNVDSTALVTCDCQYQNLKTILN